MTTAEVARIEIASHRANFDNMFGIKIAAFMSLTWRTKLRAARPARSVVVALRTSSNSR